MSLRTLFLLSFGTLAASCSQAAEPRPASPADVSHAAVSKLEKTPVDDFYEAAGSVQSRTRTTVAAKIVGSVSAVHVREGDNVSAGQLLIEIDSRDLLNQVGQAKAGLNEAQAALEEVDHAIVAGQSAKAAAAVNLQLASSTLERFTMLKDRNSVSPHEYDQVVSRQETAKAEVERADATLEAQRARRQQILARIEQAQSQIDGAMISLGYARIASPFDGIVTTKFVDKGAQAAPGVPLIGLESRDYEIAVTVPESDVTHVRSGTHAQITVPAVGLQAVSGVVATIVPDVDPATRSYTVKMRLSETPATLRSGMFARARLPVGRREILAIPASAIVERGQLTGIYALGEGDVIRLRLIKTGQRDGDTVEILSGLAPGDRVFLHPDGTVQEGSRWQP